MFSYEEHEWDVHSDDEAREERLRRAREGTWEECAVPAGEMDDESEVDTLDALRGLVVASLAADSGGAMDVIEFPFAALQQMMDEEGWTFVGGNLLEFEGHYNDTEIYAVLDKR